MATSVHSLRHVCAAAAALGDFVAVSTPHHTVEVYSRSSWQRLAVLEGHETIISGLHFHGVGNTAGGGNSPASGNSSSATPLRLVSSSHDRNSYVWTQQAAAAGTGPPTSASTSGSFGGAGWQPELVVTRLQKAGLCVAWSPCGNKFAIGGSDRMADVIYYSEDKELWAPKLIRRQLESSVTAVAWHPSGALLATVGTDSKLHLFNAVVPGVDSQASLAVLGASKFGDCLLEMVLPGGWGLAATFSPDGTTLAAASQASQLMVLSGIDLQDAATLDAAAATGRLQHLQLPSLPLKCLAFLSDSLLAGGGFDFHPLLFARQPDGQWRHAASLQGVKAGSGKAGGGLAAASSLSARIRLFETQAAEGAAAGGSSRAAAAVAAAVADPGGHGGLKGQSSSGEQSSSGPHQNTIISILPLPSSTPGSLAFLTASLEGCLAEWHVDPATL